jgi:hypothetical protein
METPNSIILNEYRYCPGLAYEYMLGVSILSPANQLFRQVIDQLILGPSFGGRDIRTKVTKHIREFFPTKIQQDYKEYSNSLIGYITELRKDFEIIERNVDVYRTGSSSFTAHVDLVYARKSGACYSIIMDPQERPKDISWYLQHIYFCAASLIDWELRSTKIIEIIIPNKSKIADKILVEINENSEKLVDFSKKLLYNTAQSFSNDKELLTNWSNKCSGCTLKGCCSQLRNSRRIPETA